MPSMLQIPTLPAAWRRDRRFALFIALSLLVHGVALWELQPLLRPLALDSAADHEGAPLIARVAPPRISVPESAAPAPSQSPLSAPPTIASAPTLQPRRTLPRVAPPPPMLEAPGSTWKLPVEPPTFPPPPEPPRAERSIAQSYPDLSAYVASRRRSRGEPSEGFAPRPSGESKSDDENAQRDARIAQNLAAINAPTIGASKESGGLFQVTRLGYDDAEFTFFGWHTEIRRRASQRIEVRRDGERDIRIAVVRRMIAIIRQYEQEDFLWRSNRLGRDVTLSARIPDSAGLEEFLMREFF
ncbi:MAG TPA: hypothetical protein VNG69_17170 [Casimicrobiaceae bacterium]|nr:hypothetical protein [Casimicrobiaceae bacterium]